MSVFDSAGQREDGLRTDLYQLTMAAAMHRAGLDHQATFELFTRRLHPNRGYWVAAGLEQALDYLEGLRFSPEQVDYLASLPPFQGADHTAFFEALRELRFSGEVWALPEGTPVFPGEPLLRITAPAIEAQLLETYLLSLINFQTLIASKAARVWFACRDHAFVDFGTRRAHGPDAAELAARAAYLAGAWGTSNVEAGRRLGIPTTGTFAHSWVMSFASEDEAFRRYAEAFPAATTLLIDTYDTVAAAERIVAQDLPCQAVRLDSGDLRQLSLDVRQVFDRGGRPELQIAASGDLNEAKIDAMEQAGCAIDVYGVGTELVTSLDCPALGGVYKLVAVRESSGAARYPIKLSSSKKSWPGVKQVYRREVEGTFAGDTIALADEAPAAAWGRPLLEKVAEGGRRLAPPPPLAEVRARCLEQLRALPAGVARLHQPEPYPVERSEGVLTLADRARDEALARLERGEP